MPRLTNSLASLAGTNERGAGFSPSLSSKTNDMNALLQYKCKDFTLHIIVKNLNLWEHLHGCPPPGIHYIRIDLSGYHIGMA